MSVCDDSSGSIEVVFSDWRLRKVISNCNSSIIFLHSEYSFALTAERSSDVNC